jgi:hypothetical protein
MHSIVFYVFLASNPRMLQLTLLLPLPLWIVRRQSPKVPNKMVQGLWAYFTSTLCSAAHSTHPRIIHQGPPSMLDALCFANRNFLWYLMLAASRLICGESLRVIQAIWSQKYFTPREVFVEQLNTTIHCTCFKKAILADHVDHIWFVQDCQRSMTLRICLKETRAFKVRFIFPPTRCQKLSDESIWHS